MFLAKISSVQNIQYPEDILMEKECLLCHDLTEAGVDILAKNMSLNSVFQDKLDWCIFGTLGHLDDATKAVRRRYVFLLCFTCGHYIHCVEFF